MNMKPILDACCGGKMFYFDKSDDRVLFQDLSSTYKCNFLGADNKQ